MRVFFNHIAKCGGTTINILAKSEYKENYHVLSPSTSIGELTYWLSKEVFFISSEIYGVSPSHLELIMKDPNITRIILGRNPISRFKSFCGHSARNPTKKYAGGVECGTNQVYIPQAVSINFWLKAALKKIELGLNSSEAEYSFIDPTGLPITIYSQWWLASIQSVYDPNSKSSIFYGKNFFGHICQTRKIATSTRQTLSKYISTYIRKFYQVYGTTECMPDFLKKLECLGVLSAIPESIPKANSSEEIQLKLKSSFKIDEILLADYFSILPEEFFFYEACMNQ